MVYVDLNPIRAKMAKTPEKSDYTSIKKRCTKAQKSKKPNTINQQDNSLLPFVGNPRKNQPQGIQVRLSDYFNLVDCTGKILREDKRGYIDTNAGSILQRLDIDEDKWLEMAKDFEGCFSSFVGSEKHLRIASEQLKYQRPPGLSFCKRIFH